MPVRLIVTFTALPGRAANLAAAWQTRLAEVHHEPGCEQYELFRSVARPDTLVLLERWSSAETLDVHSALNRTRQPIGRDLQAAPTVLERFDVS